MIRKAKQVDRERIYQVVGQAGLQTSGIHENVDNFLIMEEEQSGALIAVVGFEIHDQRGLLRSFVMTQKTDQLNILELVRAVIDFSKKNGLKTLFLCTKQHASVELFKFLGFEKAVDIPVEIKGFGHFHNINKENPIIMHYHF